MWLLTVGKLEGCKWKHEGCGFFLQNSMEVQDGLGWWLF